MLRLGIGFIIRRNHKWKIYRYYTANPIKAIKGLITDLKKEKSEASHVCDY